MDKLDNMFTEKVGDKLWANIDGWSFSFPLTKKKRVKGKSKSINKGDLLSPMPGQILKINFKEGDSVKAGEAVVLLEAMKMEHSLKAGSDTIIEKIHFKAGDQVKSDDLLVAFKKVEK